MGRSCQVCNIMDFYPEISFHNFPRDPELKRKWFYALGFPDNKYLPQKAFICCRHFKADDFINKANGVAVLKTGAVPQQPFTDKSRLKSISSSMGVHNFGLVNVDAVKELSQTQPALPQRNTSTQLSSPSADTSTDTASENDENLLCPLTGALISSLTGLEVNPPPVEPTPVFPIRVKPPAGWKNISDPKFSLTSAPVQLNTLRKDIKEEPPIEPPKPMEQDRIGPVMQQTERGVLDLDKISEEELVKLIESDSPLLTAEMVFSSKRINKKRYLGDLSMNDFVTPAGRMFYLAAKKRAEMYRSKIRTSQALRNRQRHKLGRFNRMLKILESTCDVSEAKKILEGKENDDNSSESSSSKEDDESDIEGVIMNPMTKIDPVHFATYEKKETRINHFDFSNRVQVKFLPEGDTELITTLKVEINKLAHADISKSKRIDELYNVIFKKNNIIDDLQRQIVELRAETGQMTDS